MPLVQTSAVSRRATYPATGYQSGQVIAHTFKHTFDADFTAASDILEIGALPAGAQLLEATLVSGALGSGVTATLSTMTGKAADQDDARVADEEIQAGIAAHNATTPLDIDALTDFAPAEDHRGLGLEFSANITAGSTKTVKLIVKYHF